MREVPVSSEVSDRAQYAMFSALDEYKPIYLRGDVYSGKTTAVVQVFNHNILETFMILPSLLKS